jgi:hypothetical protein
LQTFRCTQEYTIQSLIDGYVSRKQIREWVHKQAASEANQCSIVERHINSIEKFFLTKNDCNDNENGVNVVKASCKSDCHNDDSKGNQNQA